MILAAAVVFASLLSPFNIPTHHNASAASQDARISFRIQNDAPTFRDVRIDGHSYTLMTHQSIIVKAPAGAVVFANSRFGQYRAGDPLLTVVPALSDTNINLRWTIRALHAG